MSKKFLSAVVFFFAVATGILVGGDKAYACFAPAAGLNDSFISSSFPRQSANRNVNGGCGNSGTSHIFLSTYYATSVGGGPGSTLNTPNASLSVFYIGNPGPGAAISMDINVLFCMYGAVSRPVYINYGPNNTSQVGAGTRTITLAGSDFTDVSPTYGVIYGQPIYKYQYPVRLAVDGNAPRNCEVTASVSTGSITFTEDPNPTVDYADSGRPNQATFSTQNGNRAIVPAGSSLGAFAYRSTGTSTHGLHYITPFAPSCNIPAGGQTIRLRVYDADAPPSNPAGATNGSYSGVDYYPRMEVWEYDAGGNYIRTINPTGDPLNRVGVGNDEYGQYALTVMPGRKYVWHWWNVSMRNGLQLWMPFSEISARPGAACPPTNTNPSVSFTLTCNVVGQVTFLNPRVSDAEGGTLTISGSHNGQSFSGSRNGSGDIVVSPNPFTGIRDGVARNVTLSVSDSAGGSGSGFSSYTCTIPPPTVTCTFVTPNQTLEVGDNYYPVVRVSNANTAGAPTVNASVNISINLAPVQARNTPSRGPIAAGGDATYGAGTSPSVTYPSTPATGVVISGPGSFTTTATASWTANGAAYSGTIPCTGSLGAGGNGNSGVLRPYFKVLGGDLISYGTDVRGYNQQNVTFDPVTTCSAAIRCGSGVETAIQNNGYVVGVPSRYKQASGGPGQKTLTYANTLGAFYAPWGGGFGAGAPTVRYNVPTSATNWTNFAAIPANTNSEYRMNSAASQNLPGGTVPSGARVTIYATGNVRIMNNITYTGSGGYANRDAIPHLRIIAQGNIYIDPSVSQLDGEFIALGQVYTCHNGTWGAPNGDLTGVNIFGPCSGSTLIVNGGLVGDSIKLTRTTGTRRNAQATDGLTGGCAAPTAVSRGYCNTTNIAEIIQFTPELFLARPASSPTNTPISGQYNSITSLPPLF
jgi:hypothetical protein